MTGGTTRAATPPVLANSILLAVAVVDYLLILALWNQNPGTPPPAALPIVTLGYIVGRSDRPVPFGLARTWLSPAWLGPTWLTWLFIHVGPSRPTCRGLSPGTARRPVIRAESARYPIRALRAGPGRLVNPCSHLTTFQFRIVSKIQIW
jgi:hypothetical protein